MTALVKKGLLLLCVPVILALCTGMSAAAEAPPKEALDKYGYSVTGPVLQGYNVSFYSATGSNPMEEAGVYTDVVDDLWAIYQKQNQGSDALSRLEFTANLHLAKTAE